MSMTIHSFRSDSDTKSLPPPLADVAALSNAPKDVAQLGDYVRVVCRHWRLVAWAAVAGCVCGILLTLVQTPLFRAKTSIEIQNINGDFLNMKQARPVSDEAQGTDALMDLQTQIEILQSDMLAQNTKQAMEQIGLKHVWLARPTGAGALPLMHAGDAIGDSLETVLKSVADSLKVRAAGQTRIIQVQVDAPNPTLAADFANTLIAEYIRQNIKARSQMTEAAEEWTRNQLAEMREKLEAAGDKLQKYAIDHSLVFTSERQNISDDRLREVQADLLHARADLAEKEARRELVTSANADSLPDVEKDTDLRELRAKLIDLRRQEAELITVFKPGYSEVTKVRAQADELQGAINQERDRIVSRILNEYQQSKAQERLLSVAYDQAVRQAAHESQSAVQYDILKREVDANLNAYQEMLARVKELSLAAAIRTSNVRVIDVASPPKRPHSPKMPLNAALGLFSGLTLAIGFVLVHDRSNQNLRHPGEVTLRLGVPELGVIASTGGHVTKFKSLRFHKAQAALEESLNTFRSTEPDRYAATTDDFRSLLASILFSGANGDQPRSIVVTSSSSQDGKTTVATNLAVALARAGKRVLLIDGDLRNPQIHKLFGLPNLTGLGNLLQAGSDVHEAQEAVLTTSVSGLTVLTAGLFTTQPADLLFEPNLRNLFGFYRERFDMVIIDSSPVMRLPDARLLGRNSDGVVLVARANRTTRSSIVMACQRLALDRTRVLGVVLNDWNGEDSPSYPA
jgi:capsular exopolysaccharide synthesis family protein